jgi:Fe(3+) dicitrate transport protein
MNSKLTIALVALFLAHAEDVASEESPSNGPESVEADEAPADDDASSDAGIVLDPLHLGFEADEAQRIGGSVQLIDAEALEHHGQDDPEAIIQQVPGAQVRTEDGYGLRPNIGLRGVSSERSRKITLMEDGILFGPAPYAAPAAYFFPLMIRMVGVEVVKGPGTVLYGPHTVGGALNLLSRQVPEFTSGSVELSGGTDRYRRLNGWVGSSNAWGGLLFEGAYVGAGGFKEIDHRPNASTGFDRGEALLTLRLAPVLYGPVQQELVVRGGYALERSNETYLGLTDEDFDADPYRRYLGSALDRMEWERWELRLRHRLDWDSGTALETVAYRHDFQRTWRKANRFAGASFSEVLAAPDEGINAVFYEVLTGASNSASPAETIMLGSNAREYVSQGIQSTLSTVAEGDRAEHAAEVSVRLHYDRIDRDHTEEGRLVEDRELVPDGLGATSTARNRGEAIALAAYASYSVSVRDLTIRPGVRMEHVSVQFTDRATDEVTSSTDVAVLPGLGLHYQAAPDWGVFAGVHRGFSPVAPGQPASVKPEFSVAYEVGGRYGNLTDDTVAEVVGFFNDYSNMTSECAFSRGCTDEQVGNQFNAGEVDVYGAEVLLRHAFDLSNGWEIPVSVVYTLSQSRFRNAFTSSDPQLGEVEVGDHLPYLPQHQGRVEVGLDAGIWRASVAASFVGKTLEQAGSYSDEPQTDRQALLDMFVGVQPWRGLELSVRGQNLTNSRVVASRRPFGARPVRPLQVIGSVGYSF